MALVDRIRIARRFQRAVRIDSDLGNPATLDGFICPRSSAEVLETMARHVAENGQGAFTWTGPYGSGKSSLAIALCALLNGDKKLARNAESVLGRETASIIWEALPPRTRGWHFLPVVGRRDRPAQVMGEAIIASDFLTGRRLKSWTDKRVLDTIDEIAARNPHSSGGLLMFIDEMGKFLEATANDGSDIYFFQELAERASRSDKRLILVGILHQAFEEYAHRLSREMRDEWSKIQGRFVDLAVNTGGDEQIDLIGRAIESDHGLEIPGPLAENVARQTQRKTSPHFADMLEDCWPLHPIVACLLGPVSRRRFGQNQRSIFGFLNSAEPQGFQDFLRDASDDEIYAPDRLWDYLRINLEPSILASPDGHRWALAMEVLERCEAMGGEDIHLRLLKVIAVVDMFKDRSGLGASHDLLKLAFPGYDFEDIGRALDDLQRRSFIIYRKFVDAYSIFEGSDFNIDHAVEQAMGSTGELDFTALNALSGFQPIMAKRHYHENGAMRWFDVVIAPLAEIENVAADYVPLHGAIGSFFLTIPTQGESKKMAVEICSRVAQMSSNWDIVIGLSQRVWGIQDLIRELLALGQVRDETPELQGDRIARIEVHARIGVIQEQLEGEFSRAFNSAFWYHKRFNSKLLPHAELNRLASDIVDARFGSAPRLHNELLGHVKPSSNAVATQNTLLRLMALNEGEPRLGIKGFPAEGGLLASLLEATGLYRETEEGWRFMAPEPGANDPRDLEPTWQAAMDLLKVNSHRAVPVAEIYDVWRQAPFGIKDGLLPVLAVAFLLSQRTKLAFYRQGIFQASVSDLDMDYLARDPADIQLRWMNLTETSRQLLSEMADIVRELQEDNTLAHMEPIDVAKGLVAIYDQLPAWVRRTQRLSGNSKRIRQLFKQANDPNRLIFDDIPSVIKDCPVAGELVDIQQVANYVREGLMELLQVYPTMLNRMRDSLLTELQVSNETPSMLAELRARASNIRDLGGDYRLEAFIVRLSQFEGQAEEIEGLASMSVNKPPRDWIDPDIDRAMVELAELAQKFLRAEAFAHVKGRKDKRHAMAVVIGIGGRPTPAHDEFDITDPEREEVNALIDQIDTVLKHSGEKRRNVILAALAELSARHLRGADIVEPEKRGGKKWNAW